MPITFTFFKSMAGHCALSPIAAIMSTRRSVDQDVDDQGDKEEHVDEASLKPGKRWFTKSNSR